MSGESLEIIYDLDCISEVDVWDIVFQELRKRNISQAISVELYGKRLKLEQVRENIRKANKGHFLVAFDKLSVRFGSVTNYEHTLLMIRYNSESKDYHWDQWVYALLSVSEFMQAWVVNNEYDHWQNAHDPIQYKAKGRSYAGLPMKSNDLPPPLEQMIIDTSNNPGRRIVRMGYVEAIGSPMWLGRPFWERTGADKKSVMEAFAKDAQLMENEVVRIQVSDKPFTENTDPALQNRLRQMLYPGG